MLHTSLSVKKSWPLNWKLFNAPTGSKKNGSLRHPAKKPVLAGFGYSRVPIQGNRRVFDDGLSAIAGPGGLRALSLAGPFFAGLVSRRHQLQIALPHRAPRCPLQGDLELEIYDPAAG